MVRAPQNLCRTSLAVGNRNLSHGLMPKENMLDRIGFYRHRTFLLLHHCFTQKPHS